MAKTVSFSPTRKAELNSFVNIDRNQPVRPQVLEAIEKVGPALQGAEINLIGMGVPAIMQVAALELLIGLPTISIVEPGRPGGPEPRYVGPFLLDFYRNKVAREYRKLAWRKGESHSGYTVINGSGRDIPAHQLDELARELAHGGIAERAIRSSLRVLDAPMDKIADFSDPASGMAEILASLPLTRNDWQSGQIVIFCPGLGLGATLFATTVYALAERWPLIANLQSGADRTFHLVELCDPQPMRDWGQALAVRWQNDQTAKLLEVAAFDLMNVGCGAYSEGNTIYFELPGSRKLKVVASAAEILNS